MKIRFVIPLIMSLWLPMAVMPLVIGCGGCSAVTEGSDAIVVRAEQASRYSFEIFDTFLAEEERNRALWRQISPDIEKAANHIRRDGRKAVEELVKVTRTYKTNRTPENRVNLVTLTAVVQDLIRIAEQNLALGRAASQ